MDTGSARQPPGGADAKNPAVAQACDPWARVAGHIVGRNRWSQSGMAPRPARWPGSGVPAAVPWPDDHPCRARQGLPHGPRLPDGPGAARRGEPQEYGTQATARDGRCAPRTGPGFAWLQSPVSLGW